MANKIFFLGWAFMLSGLALPMVTIPMGDLKIGSLVMFLGLHNDAYGLQIAMVLLIAPMKHLGWWLFTIPVWLGLLAPIFLKVKSITPNIFLALCYGIGFIALVNLLLSLKVDGLTGVGYYIWMVALFILMASRIKACSD